MTLIYRIEHRRLKRGPYNPGGGLTERQNKLWSRAMCPIWDADWCEHPTPLGDGIETFIENLHFSAFGSLRSLNEWFGRALSGLYRAGFAVVVLEVADEFVQRGGCQVAVELKHATRLSYLSLTDLRKALAS